MRLLLDTHSFLWFIMGSPKLSMRARELIEEVGNERLFSTASLWEMAIKISLGKLSLAEPFGELIPRQIEINGIELLHIQVNHLSEVSSLPFYHRDPFDRLLVAQCLVERLPFVSSDSVFDSYQVERLW